MARPNPRMRARRALALALASKGGFAERNRQDIEMVQYASRTKLYNGKDVEGLHRRPEFMKAFRGGVERGDPIQYLASKLSSAYRPMKPAWKSGELVSLVSWISDNGPDAAFAQWWASQECNPRRGLALVPDVPPEGAKNWKVEAEYWKGEAATALESLGTERHRIHKLESDLKAAIARADVAENDRTRVLLSERNNEKTKRSAAEYAHQKAEEQLSDVRAELAGLRASQSDSDRLVKSLSDEQAEITRLRSVMTGQRNELEKLKDDFDAKHSALSRALSEIDKLKAASRASTVRAPTARAQRAVDEPLRSGGAEVERIRYLTTECGMTTKQAIDLLRSAE